MMVMWLVLLQHDLEVLGLNPSNTNYCMHSNSGFLFLGINEYGNNCLRCFVTVKRLA